MTSHGIVGRQIPLRRQTPLPCEQIDTCENNTLPHTPYDGAKISKMKCAKWLIESPHVLHDQNEITNLNITA